MDQRNTADHGIGKAFAVDPDKKAQRTFPSKIKSYERQAHWRKRSSGQVCEGWGLPQLLEVSAQIAFLRNLLPEIVRQHRKNLRISGHTATHDFQILAAGDCIAGVDITM